MTLYGKIVDGELVEVGDLPQSAVRLSTNEVINDLPNTGRRWMTDAGWFDLETVDPLELIDDPAKREALTAGIAAALSASSGRRASIDRVRDVIALALDKNWQWIDLYCHPLVAQVGFIAAQSPMAGSTWAALSATDKAEALRLGVSLAMAEIVRLAQGQTSVLDLLERFIELDPSIMPPADR